LAVRGRSPNCCSERMRVCLGGWRCAYCTPAVAPPRTAKPDLACCWSSPNRCPHAACAPCDRATPRTGSVLE
jgi:hypothetical protein